MNNVGWTPRPSEYQREITDEASVLRVFQQAARALRLIELPDRLAEVCGTLAKALGGDHDPHVE